MVKPCAQRQYIRAVSRCMKEVNLANVKRIKVSYNPFVNTVSSAREFLYYMSSRKVQETNYGCILMSNVQSDMLKPVIECSFNNGEKAVFKTENLSLKDIVEKLNDLCQQKL